MRCTACLALVAAAALAACTRATPEQQVVNDAAEALGGSDRILAVKTLIIEGGGSQGNLGQDMTPDATGQSFTVTAYKRSIDVTGARARTELTRQPNFAFFQGQAPQRQVQGVDGNVGYNVAANGNATRVADAAASDRRVEIYHHPLTSVRAALEQGATLTNRRTANGQDLIDVRTAGGLVLTLAIDRPTRLPSRVTSTTYNTNLGDVTIETAFAGYQEVGSLQLPTRLTTKTDETTTAELVVTNQAIDGDAGDLAAPEAAASAAPITAPAPANVTVQELARGIWLLGGQSHHSVLVEFGDHLTLIEAPQNETRTLAVIARAREIRPNKPLTQVINTHHHFDHSGGIRAAISEGLTVIAHQNSVAFFQEAAGRPHTIVQDALARSPRPLTIEGVQDEKVLTDGTMTVNLYAIEGSPHADTFVMAYFPRERILVEVDLYTPGAAVSPYAPNLLENIRKRNLRVNRIVPLHGSEAPIAEFMKTAQAAAAATATN